MDPDPNVYADTAYTFGLGSIEGISKYFVKYALTENNYKHCNNTSEIGQLIP